MASRRSAKIIHTRRPRYIYNFMAFNEVDTENVKIGKEIKQEMARLLPWLKIFFLLFRYSRESSYNILQSSISAGICLQILPEMLVAVVDGGGCVSPGDRGFLPFWFHPLWGD